MGDHCHCNPHTPIIQEGSLNKPGGAQSSQLVSHRHPRREIIKKFKDLSPNLARAQREVVKTACGSRVLLATNPPGGVKLCQRMKLKYLKYNPCASFSEAGGEIV